MSLKRKIFVFCMVTGVIVTGLLIREFAPEGIVENPQNVSLERLLYEGEEITADENRVIEIIKKYDARRSLKNFFPTKTDEMKIQMILEDGKKVKHIILGEPDIWYEAEKRTGYEIQDADKLLGELESLFEN